MTVFLLFQPIAVILAAILAFIYGVVTFTLDFLLLIPIDVVVVLEYPHCISVETQAI